MSPPSSKPRTGSAFLSSAPVATACEDAAQASVRQLRASRREVQRLTLLRKSAAARAALDALSVDQDGQAVDEQPSAAETSPADVQADCAASLDERCNAWRALVAKRAYLSTLPPPEPAAEPTAALRKTL